MLTNGSRPARHSPARPEGSNEQAVSQPRWPWSRWARLLKTSCPAIGSSSRIYWSHPLRRICLILAFRPRSGARESLAYFSREQELLRIEGPASHLDQAPCSPFVSDYVVHPYHYEYGYNPMIGTREGGRTPRRCSNAKPRIRAD
jgi:hypothetical protein